MKKTSFIIAAMMAAVMLVGCGKTTANAAPTTEYSKSEAVAAPAPKVEQPKVEAEAPKKAPAAEAPKPAAKAEAPKETEQLKKVEAVSIEATVNGTHNVGDTLSAKDFTVTINMSDGSKVKNPAGWTANPLVLSSESTAIMVAYNGLSTKITVKANPVAVQQQPAAPKPEAKRPYPDSAYEPISQKARDDFYAYAYAHGYETYWYKDVLGRMHENAAKYNIDTETGETYMDYAFLIDYYSNSNVWVVQYATPHDGWEIHETREYTGTLEFLYKLL